MKATDAGRSHYGNMANVECLNFIHRLLLSYYANDILF